MRQERRWPPSTPGYKSRRRLSGSSETGHQLQAIAASAVSPIRRVRFSGRASSRLDQLDVSTVGELRRSPASVRRWQSTQPGDYVPTFRGGRWSGFPSSTSLSGGRRGCLLLTSERAPEGSIQSAASCSNRSASIFICRLRSPNAAAAHWPRLQLSKRMAIFPGVRTKASYHKPPAAERIAANGPELAIFYDIVRLFTWS